MTGTPQWFREATEEQLRELLALASCISAVMVDSLSEWAQERVPWYMGINSAIQTAREDCEENA